MPRRKANTLPMLAVSRAVHLLAREMSRVRVNETASRSQTVGGSSVLPKEDKMVWVAFGLGFIFGVVFVEFLLWHTAREACIISILRKRKNRPS